MLLKMSRMKMLVGISIGILLVGILGTYAVFAYQNMRVMTGMMGQNDMMSGMTGGNNMMTGMMSQTPQDVIVKVTSGQLTKVGKESKIVLLVLDKETKKPLPNADVIIGIERGASMTTMNMMGGMFKAEDIGSGKYIVRFIPDTKGYLTMHTHVIPNGKSMHSMMENHLDIGIIAK